jgi:hypothetical protein
MTPPISHIFDQSSCLSMRQLKEYVAGTQTHEERHATEHHLNDCSLCSEAVQGLYAKKDAVANLSGTLNSTFLKQHIQAVHPQDHAPASHPIRPAQRRQRYARAEGGSPVAFAPLISAVLILFGYLLWQKPQVPTPTPHHNTVRAGSHTSAPAHVPEAVVIPVRHGKTEKAKAPEAEVVQIPASAKAQIESMQRAEIATVPFEEKPQQPRPVSLRPAIVEVPKKNVMTVVAGDMETNAGRPANSDIRKPDEIKPFKKLEAQAFTADGHAAVKPPVQAKPDPRAGSTSDAQALNKTESNTVRKPDQAINRNEVQALNIPKASAPAKQEVEVVVEGKPKGAADQFESREAAMNAARDLQKQGKPEEARQILNDLAGSSGAQKRAAKKMLRKMNNGEE